MAEKVCETPTYRGSAVGGRSPNHTAAGPTIVIRTCWLALSIDRCNWTKEVVVPLRVELAPPHAVAPLACLLKLTSTWPLAARSMEQPVGREAFETVMVVRVVLGSSLEAASKHSAAVAMVVSPQAGPELLIR